MALRLPGRLRRFRPDWVAVILVGLIAYLWFRPPADISAENFPAPAVTVRLLDGGEARLADLRGKAVLVSFWASWCPYCRREKGAIQAFYADWRAKGFEVLALSIDESEAALRQHLADAPYAVPVAFAGEASRAFGGVSSIPTSFVIDRQGVVRHKVTGQLTYGRLEDLVGPLLQP
jgi:peroxiredoxin